MATVAAMSLLWSCFSASARAECGDGLLDPDTEECDIASASVAELCTDGCRVPCETNVNDGATDHTCQHVSFGPFGAVAGNAYPGVVNSVISQTHVYVTVAMARNEADEVVDSAVNLFPIKSGTFALYLNEAEVVTLLDAQGGPVPALLDTAITTCAAGLSRVQVHVLDVNESYLLVFPAEGSASRSLVVEELGEHAHFYSADDDGDGFGQPQSALLTWCKLGGDRFVQDEQDCDDSRATVFIGAPELCDGLDNDCDGEPEQAGEACQDDGPAADTSTATGASPEPTDAQVPDTANVDGGAIEERSESLPDRGETTPNTMSTSEARESSPISNTPDAGRAAASRVDHEVEHEAGKANTHVDEVVGTSRASDSGCTVGPRSGAWGWLGALMLLSCTLCRRVTGSRR